MNGFMELLKFIFRDFWTFCGIIILIYAVGTYCITAPIVAIASIFANKDENKKKENDEKGDE